MCGIAGIWFRDGRELEPDQLAAMLAKLRHRGPDECNTWGDEAIGIGHTRLRIIDPTEASAQPMRSANGRFVLSYNGEIHNYRELRKELEQLGHRFRTTGDTEVVMVAFEQWGPDAFQRFNGMWALAVWDGEEHHLTLCRDRFGIKPLYYSINGDRIVFASEPKAILAAFPQERTPDYEEIHAYLHGGSPDVGANTFFANIHALMPAHSLTVGRDFSPRLTRYWDIGPEQKKISFGDAVDEFRQLLRDSVAIRMRSDVQVGAALSGGLDSSAVVALATSDDMRLDCFCLRYDGKPYDESKYAAAVAERVACPVNWVEPDGADTMDRVQEIVYHHDSPPPIRGRLPHWAVMRQASQHVRVMLEGTGSDELLAGYDFMLTPYLQDRLTAIVRSRDWGAFKSLRHDVRQLNAVRGDRKSYLRAWLTQKIKRRLPTYPWKHCETREFRRQFGKLDSLRFRDGWKAEPELRQFGGQLRNALWFDFCFAGLPESLHGADAASMAHSVEARAPFLDHRLVEFCFALPDEHKIRGGWTKSVLRHAMRGTLPESVLSRRQKLGFPAPYGEWLSSNSSLATITDTLLSRQCLERGILDESWLKRLLLPRDRGKKFVRRYVGSVWRMTCLELWFRRFVDE